MEDSLSVQLEKLDSMHLITNVITEEDCTLLVPFVT